MRLGVARHVPRGLRREDWQSGGYFDQWVPLLAPTSDLVANYRQKKVRFATFARLYQNQMKAPASRQVIDLLATIALFLPISIGCYCEDESLCHRSVLRKLLLKAAESKTGVFESFREMRESGDLAKFASPVCFRDLEEE
jgi:uncharacterized protein YeaO (DUF488 family)